MNLRKTGKTKCAWIEHLKTVTDCMADCSQCGSNWFDAVTSVAFTAFYRSQANRILANRAKLLQRLFNFHFPTLLSTLTRNMMELYQHFIFYINYYGRGNQLTVRWLNLKLNLNLTRTLLYFLYFRFRRDDQKINERKINKLNNNLISKSVTQKQCSLRRKRSWISLYVSLLNIRWQFSLFLNIFIDVHWLQFLAIYSSHSQPSDWRSCFVH